MSDIPRGNDPKQYFIGPVREEQGGALHEHMQELITNQIKPVDLESDESGTQLAVGCLAQAEQHGAGELTLCDWWFYLRQKRNIAQQQMPAKRF